MEISVKEIGDLVIEGKTKRVFNLKTNDSLVFVLSKDRITAGDGLKAHELKGKAEISTKTNCALFRFLQSIGIPTHFVDQINKDSHPDWQRAFVARKCQMVPIEFVARRVATGSFLKRHPNVEEGFRFCPPKLETFFKDDANHDPFWSEESLVSANLKIGNVVIKEKHVQRMLSTTRVVFEAIERVWQTADHALIDMKIEFGVLADGSIVVADVIDNDSWRLWPSGEKRLMLDKQIYRNLKVEEIDSKALEEIRGKFEIVAQRTHRIFTDVLPTSNQSSAPVVAILLGSSSDRSFAEKIVFALKEKFGIKEVSIDVCSAHKATEKAIRVVHRLEQSPRLRAIIAVAGMSNGLGPVTAGLATVPVFCCPPTASADSLALDLWSSVRMPSGIGCSTVLGAENAALASAQVVGVDNPWIWSRIRAQKLSIRLTIEEMD
ncbi:bifunctional phosphoribosylaminoimidazole carboxylase/phosphoribosylaminoimidazole succinocarboxamide synthetase-like [Oppia nitens]|uniref:bifunctional phosphoribosylaminoimidazole carboxylase/phosphoribosylaminoimidazole succinocarboxamide synthetase-like n=1 Tax=Oppia nitens TaxID=1686743 RepID=UPI0023DB3ACA|nr:bifunctional phosphoribosylaminoimidazole carboxylase/phosphoribosylaminoimidazole succinocarboxamide synthetase-like [Oppia nitens]